jgi:hypothetical protein
MPKGMKYPIGVSPSGGAITIEGTIVIDQNIVLAIYPAGSLHPWNQKLAPDENFIFDIKDNRSGGLFSMHVREFFQEMERNGYARLLPGRQGLNVDYGEDGGDMVVNIYYINLETGDKVDVHIPLPGE